MHALLLEQRIDIALSDVLFCRDQDGERIDELLRTISARAKRSTPGRASDQPGFADRDVEQGIGECQACGRLHECRAQLTQMT